MNTMQSKSINGVNVEQLIGTINAVKENADIALFKFRSKTTWLKGGHCRTEIKDFYGALQEDTSRASSFLIDGDEPAVLLGENHGVNAVESVLHALASCLSVGIVYNASAMDIEIKSLNFSLEGEIDLHAFLGLSDSLRPGYKNITVNVHAQTSADDRMEELLEYVKKTSPVLDIISNPVPVAVKLA